MNHDITRRQFTATGAALVTVTIAGCGDSSPPAPRPPGGSGGAPSAADGKNANRARLATEPFQIGKPRDFARPAIYDAFKQEKGVWIVSDGKEVVVFSATCTHTGCTTHRKGNLFVCPCHDSKFDQTGAEQEGSKAKRPLDRCSVALVKTPAGDIIEVDPRKLLRKADGGWDEADASIKLG